MLNRLQWHLSFTFFNVASTLFFGILLQLLILGTYKAKYPYQGGIQYQLSWGSSKSESNKVPSIDGAGLAVMATCLWNAQSSQMKSLSWKYKIGTIVYSSPTIADSRKATSGRVESFIKGLVSSKHTTYQISNILVICKAFGHQLYMNKSPC